MFSPKWCLFRNDDLDTFYLLNLYLKDNFIINYENVSVSISP